MDVIEEQKTYHQRSVEFFDSRTPEDPAYYSPIVLAIHNESYTRIDTKRGREMLEKLKNMDWKEVLREYLRNWIKYGGSCNVGATKSAYDLKEGDRYGYYASKMTKEELKPIEKILLNIEKDNQQFLKDCHYKD